MSAETEVPQAFDVSVSAPLTAPPAINAPADADIRKDSTLRTKTLRVALPVRPMASAIDWPHPEHSDSHPATKAAALAETMVYDTRRRRAAAAPVNATPDVSRVGEIAGGFLSITRTGTSYT